jgi:hypothetical protein
MVVLILPFSMHSLSLGQALPDQFNPLFVVAMPLLDFFWNACRT